MNTILPHNKALGARDSIRNTSVKASIVATKADMNSHENGVAKGYL